MNTCFVFEKLNNVKQLEQTKQNGLMTLSGVFGVCGVRNNNNRVYEKSNYGKMVKEMKAIIAEQGSIPGELEHPNTMTVNLENISHKITDINIDESGVVTGTIQLLNTPKGQLAQAIVEGGLPLFVSSRAQGQIDKNGNVTLEKLATFDLVGSPGFSQARMHLNESQVFESVNDDMYIIKNGGENNINENNSDIENMDEILEKISLLESRISDLEEENLYLKDRILQKKDLEKIAEAVQEWVVEDYTPKLEEWLGNNNKVNESKVKKLLTEKVAPAFQEWVIEHVAPEIQKWIVEDYSPEVQKWIVEDYSPEVQKWIVEDYSPEVRNWMVESYGPAIQKWVVEDYAPVMESFVNKNIKDDLNESIKTTKEDKFAKINEMLSIIEQYGVQKPAYPGGRMITESVKNDNEPLYIQLMPEIYRAKYNMASQAVKESIKMRASIINLNDEASINRFWERVDFTEKAPVNESQQINHNDVADHQVRMLRNHFRSFMKNR